MSCRYEEDYEYDEKRYEEYYEAIDAIDELARKEGKIIEDFPTMSHAARLVKLKRYPHLAAELAAIDAEQFTGDEGFELLSTAAENGASLDYFSSEFLTRFTPDQYYQLCRTAVDYDPNNIILMPNALRLIPDVKYRELYRFALRLSDGPWIWLYKHQSTIKPVISDEEHCRIMVEFFLRRPEALNRFSHELDAPLLDDGHGQKPHSPEEKDKRFRICKEVVTQLPSALECIYNGGMEPGILWCFSDDQFAELKEAAGAA